MRASEGPDLVTLDDALLALRRLLESPGPTVNHGPGRVEVSTMLVVNAISRSAAPASSIGDVAAALSVAHSTASRLVERAVRAGMVVRARAEGDARRTRLGLTPAGEELQREAVRFRTGRLAGALTGWTDADVATLSALLTRFAADVRRLPPPEGGAG